MTDDLATRLEAGPGSRELSDDVLLALGWRRSHNRISWTRPNSTAAMIGGARPDPARSVDDGLALAGDDWAAILGEAFDQLCELDQALGGDFTLARLPLFICAALVRAKEQETASE